MNENQPRVRTITVIGDAEVRAAPNEVILNLGVEAIDKSLSTAKQQNDEVVQRVLKLARENGLESKYAQTDYLSVEPVYQHEFQHDKKEFIGYRVRKSVVLTIRDVSKVESILTQALQGGATHVHGIEFQSTELKRHRAEARALAVKAALAKAQALASELNESIGEPIRIHEEEGRWRPWNISWWGHRGMMEMGVSQNSAEGGTSDLESTIAPGQLSITAKVTVEFALK
jgi:hypothetical protein